ncbi:hypothetical protein C1646_758538 [Rhizophagus diaphanus]|nr:hypothetical protein C1646_758538 [Rhizophagus diaphanus] [Rhizophagus sp. MUCL 43196]
MFLPILLTEYIQRTTINKTWKDHQKWLEVLSTSQAAPSGVPLTDGMLQQKGLELENCANGWASIFEKDDDDINNEEMIDNEQESNEESLLNRLPESDDVIEYFKTLDHEIPTLLMNKLLIWYKLINHEVNNDEIPAISVKKAVSGPETFIDFFEQQNDIMEI